ncbi:MAG: ATP-binding protein [Planctomycetota bacterium]
MGDSSVAPPEGAAPPAPFPPRACGSLVVAVGLPLSGLLWFGAAWEDGRFLPYASLLILGILLVVTAVLARRLRSAVEESDRRNVAAEASVQRLQEMDRLKSDFLASVSHELRTPLTSVRSFSEILLNYPDEDLETRTRFLKIINEESQRLTNLINDVLDLAKIEAGRIAWNMSVCLLEEAIDRSVEVAKGLEPEKEIRIVLDRPEAMPALFGDRDRLLQACLNLIGNAVKFSPPKSEILVRAGVEGTEPGRLWFSVTDQGPGIPAALKDRLFRKFEQIQESGAPKPSGTGLGLAISREIVEAHGGTIEVDSEEGKGTTFRVILPAWKRDTEFRTSMEFWIRQSVRRGYPLSVLVLGSDEATDPVDFSKRLKALMIHTVRSSLDNVVLHERPGFVAVFILASLFAAERIRERVLDRIRKGEMPADPTSVPNCRWAVEEHPKDGADVGTLSAILSKRLQAPGAGMPANAIRESPAKGE